MRVHIGNSSEPPLEQSGLDILYESTAVITFLTILGVVEKSSAFRLVLKGKVCSKIPQSSRLESPERISVNNFAFAACRRHDVRTIQLRRNKIYRALFANHIKS